MDNERLETALARQMGVPFDLDHFYMPLVTPADVAARGIAGQFVISKEKLNYRVISEFCARLKPHYNPVLLPHEEVKARGLGLGYGEPDNYIYDAVLRAFQPTLIIEIGSGVTTYYARNACSARIISVEPYPGPNFAEWCRESNVELWNMPLQAAVNELPITANTLLFVDSTHVTKITSEVHLIFTKLLPRLPKGSLIHFHDIFLPFPCLRPDHNSFSQTVNWYESVLLGVFLEASNQFEVVMPQYWLGFEEEGRAILRDTVPLYGQTGAEGSAFWMRKIAEPSGSNW